jgi:hypothetical protein
LQHPVIGTSDTVINEDREDRFNKYWHQTWYTEGQSCNCDTGECWNQYNEWLRLVLWTIWRTSFIWSTLPKSINDRSWYHRSYEVSLSCGPNCQPLLMIDVAVWHVKGALHLVHVTYLCLSVYWFQQTYVSQLQL